MSIGDQCPARSKISQACSTITIYLTICIGHTGHVCGQNMCFAIQTIILDLYWKIWMYDSHSENKVLETIQEDLLVLVTNVPPVTIGKTTTKESCGVSAKSPTSQDSTIQDVFHTFICFRLH